MRPLPPTFARWFAARGWQIHPHQQALLDRADDPATLLVAPTGGGKTVVGLLMLKSCLNEGVGPAVYVTPDNYLVSQGDRKIKRPFSRLTCVGTAVGLG